MTAIDWTQPVETTEDPPRPVRVLATDRPNSNHPIVVMRDDGQIFAVGLDGDGIPQLFKNGTWGTVTLRNVPPPKPKPVLHEAWVWWNSAGKATVSLNEEWCIHQKTRERGVYTRAAVMSDGSPVPGEDDLATKQITEFAERYQDDVNHWKAKAEALQADADRARPVVENAVIWERHFSPLAGERLAGSVREYLKGKS